MSIARFLTNPFTPEQDARPRCWRRFIRVGTSCSICFLLTSLPGFGQSHYDWVFQNGLAPAVAPAADVAPGCQLQFVEQMTDLHLTDCDNDGLEIWMAPLPAARGSEGCGPVRVLQTAGFPAGSPVPTGTYEIKVTAVAVNKTTGQLVQTDQIVQLRISKDNEPPRITAPKSLTIQSDTPLPDFRSNLQVNDNCTPADSIRLQQSPPAGVIIHPDLLISEIIFDAYDLSENKVTISIPVTKL